jgi:soluble lytic murein transglycosylase
VGGEPRRAAIELDSIVRRHGTHAEATAARYWAGRAWAAVGVDSAARARWQVSSERDREGYYGAASRRRLGGSPWTPPPAPDLFAPIRDVDSALARATLLGSLGMDREAGWEIEMVVRSADSTTERMLAVAHALRERGDASRAIRLALRALGRGAPADARTYRLIYPVVHREAIAVEATSRGIYPELAAALIRQESMFTPSATSAAGARGLMQVMPEVGRTVARALRFPIWDPVLLYQADVNVQLGMAHLDELVERYDEPVRVLAAYNAGASRVERWSEREGVKDPELFAERIPYAETRDYVRIIQRNQDYYRALYTWGNTP